MINYTAVVTHWSCLDTSVMLGTKLMAPPVTNRVGFLEKHLVAASLIYCEVTASI